MAVTVKLSDGGDLDFFDPAPLEVVQGAEVVAQRHVILVFADSNRI